MPRAAAGGVHFLATRKLPNAKVCLKGTAVHTDRHDESRRTGFHLLATGAASVADGSPFILRLRRNAKIRSHRYDPVSAEFTIVMAWAIIVTVAVIPLYWKF